MCRDTASGENAVFYVKEIWLRLENPGKESGWLRVKSFCYSPAALSQVSKKAVLAAGADTDTFTIEDRKDGLHRQTSENVAWRRGTSDLRPRLPP